MKRITIALPDEMSQLVEREVRRRETSVSALARDALSSYLGIAGDRKQKIPFAALGRSGKKDTASRMEEILAKELSSDSGR